MTGYAFSRSAAEDLAAILEYVEARGGVQAAAHVFRTFDADLARLAESPGMGRPHASAHSSSLRAWLVYRYLVLYEPGVVPIRIVRIVHGARAPTEIEEQIRRAELDEL